MNTDEIFYASLLSKITDGLNNNTLAAGLVDTLTNAVFSPAVSSDLFSAMEVKMEFRCRELAP